MINAQDLPWNKLVSLKDKPATVQEMNAADCCWQKTLEDLRNADANLQVLVTGIQNSGKSTLCNLLVGDFDNKTFEIGDREVTLEVKCGIMPKIGATILDTPGFGTTAARDAGFERLWAHSDILVFATSVLSGSLADHAEVKRNLIKIIRDSPDLSNRICVVCTKLSDSEDADEILEKNRSVAKEMLGCETPVFLVDSHWYEEGMKTGDEELIQVSGILPFLDWLKKTCELPSRKENIFESAKQEWLDKLNNARKAIESSITDQHAKRENLKSSLLIKWSNLRNNFQSAWEQCKRYAK